MKALTIRQPWASLIARCGKIIENRPWFTSYRGPLLIHAAKQPIGARSVSDLADAVYFMKQRGLMSCTLPLPDFNSLPFGQIIAVADLVDCVRSHPSPWFVGPFGWVLENVQPVVPIYCQGKLGLWEISCRPAFTSSHP